ncbi:MAG TPA: tRNA dihydrouridine(20/20a) synthase DusA [Caulobacteraceae bacterium]|nr:tRNA dihydrouridine(20/20a) synthase DusA [Caulobacteraceae bacterium]
MKRYQTHRLCVAPMMDWTDRHCRRLHRGLSAHARLYTEMLTAEALIHGDRARLLGFDAGDHPVALQLGGANPLRLAEAARIGEGFGYDEVNLNVGCPSDRVQDGRFGACLMREPDLVAECVAAIGAAVRVPATVKCRLGVDDQDPEASLFRLVDACAGAGASIFVVHARKAWLKGLSPKENREILPLDHGLVYRLKVERPDLTVVINGGIASLEEAQAHLGHVDGVMLGRAAYHEPGLLGAVDRRLFDPAAAVVDEVEAVRRYRPHIARELAVGTRLNVLVKPMLGLFHGAPGARTWRRILTVESIRPGAGLEVLDAALEAIEVAAAKRLEPA